MLSNFYLELLNLLDIELHELLLFIRKYVNISLVGYIY